MCLGSGMLLALAIFQESDVCGWIDAQLCWLSIAIQMVDIATVEFACLRGRFCIQGSIGT